MTEQVEEALKAAFPNGFAFCGMLPGPDNSINIQRFCWNPHGLVCVDEISKNQETILRLFDRNAVIPKENVDVSELQRRYGYTGPVAKPGSSRPSNFDNIIVPDFLDLDALGFDDDDSSGRPEG
jgi:hypothetical protein